MCIPRLVPGGNESIRDFLMHRLGQLIKRASVEVFVDGVMKGIGLGLAQVQAERDTLHE